MGIVKSNGVGMQDGEICRECEKIRKIANELPRVSYELGTLMQAILGVCEMHIGKAAYHDDVLSAFASINDSAKLLQSAINRSLESLGEMTKDIGGDGAVQTFELAAAGKRVEPVKMPYGRVLVVDDLEINLFVTKGLLAFYDLQVETVNSGHGAIERVQHGAVYDIILMDLMMPEMDGLAAMRGLRKLGYAMPIVAFSANSSKHQDEERIAQGFDCALAKPIKLNSLDELLHTYIRNRHPAHVVRKAEEDALSKKTATQESLAANGCILMIGNDVHLMNTLVRLLSSLYSVKATRKPDECLHLAIKHSVDLIILDAQHGNQECLELLDELKSFGGTKHIPVIVISNNEMDDDEEKALVGGAVDFLNKPLLEEVLKLRVGLHIQHFKQFREAESSSLVDSLTGANNRRSFDNEFAVEWNRAARSQKSFAMLMLDIDLFKSFNDTYGHLKGDEVLKKVARTLVASVKRGSDTVFRWGGEEFAVILPNTPIDGTVAVAECIRKNIEHMGFEIDGKAVKVTVSVGAGSTVPDLMSSYENGMEFSKRVDEALYEAKRQGRNRVVAASL